jgi:microcystin degradation protein MlrC
MRIAITGFSHETNTYCRGLTRIGDFKQVRGQAMARASGQQTDLGGAIDACCGAGIEAVPLMYVVAQPSGTIERETFESFADEILERLVAAGPLDGLVLLLHGAGVVEGLYDLEAELVARIRKQVGEQLPIAASFDLHGNITQAMADHLNGVFACQQYPHIDLHLAAAKAVDHVISLAQGAARSSCHVEPLPLLLPTTTTFIGIGEQILASIKAIETRSTAQGVIDISWFHGFPYTDVPHVGSSIVVTTTGTSGAAIAASVARELWAAREAFRVISLSADEAVALAQAESSYPVVIHETSDNCGGGTPGDGTHLLRAMLGARLGGDACFGFVVDAEVAQQAHHAGVGANISISLGGKTDDLHGKPLEVMALVKALHDGRVTMQHMFRGMPLNLGPLARLVIEDMDVVVGSVRSQTFDKEPFLAVGIDVMRYKYVALKSSNHFRACYQALASKIITADPPGLSTHRLEVFPRQTTTRRFWPTDPAADY